MSEWYLPNIIIPHRESENMHAACSVFSRNVYRYSG